MTANAEFLPCVRVVNEELSMEVAYYPIKRFTGGVDSKKVYRVVTFDTGYMSKSVISKKDYHYDLQGRLNNGFEITENIDHLPQLVNTMNGAC